MSNIWLTSDHHFCHANIIKYCNRPFKTVQEMDLEMIRRWNDVVASGDIVYHLGDFCLASRSVITALVSTLHGTKILIKGNHDRSAKAMKECGFHSVHKALSSEIGGQWINMSHKADWFVDQDVELGGIVLCGHSHEKWKMKGGVLNVGIDQWDFRPISLQQVTKEYLM